MRLGHINIFVANLVQSVLIRVNATQIPSSQAIAMHVRKRLCLRSRPIQSALWILTFIGILAAPTLTSLGTC